MHSWDSQDSWSNYSSRPPEALENVLYTHLQGLRQRESPETLLRCFQQLFIEGTCYGNAEVATALHQLCQHANIEREFKYILNRCCYILVNYWYTQPRHHWAIAKLIALFDREDGLVLTGQGGSPRLLALVQTFVNSEQYTVLSRLRQIFEQSRQQATTLPPEEQPLAQRIITYPFLYDHSLLTKDSSQEQKQNVLDMRQQAEKDLGIRLARFHAVPDRPATNPTLLDTPSLQTALKHYTGKLDGNRTQRDLAHWFTAYSKTTRCFRDFKGEFVDYLINPVARVEPKYAGNHFTRSLRQYLQETLAEFDGQQVNNFMRVEICRRVLNFLVVDSPQRPVFRNFRHLIKDIGYPLTVGMLLRVVLFCSSAKPWLERCFAVLFNLHERRLCKDVPWLVTSLEHTNVALVTNFRDVGYQF